MQNKPTRSAVQQARFPLPALPALLAAWATTTVLLVAAGVPQAAYAQPATPAVAAATAQATAQATALSLMKASGLWDQLSGIAQQVQTGFETEAANSASPPSPAEQQRLAGAIHSAYEADRLRTQAQNTLAKLLQPQHVAPLQAWYASALGQKIKQLEVTAAADTRGTQVVVQEGAAALAQATPLRQAAVQRMVVVTRAAQSLATLTISTALAVQQGIAAATAANFSSADVKQAKAQMEEQLNSQRPRIEALFAEMSAGLFCAQYTTLSDAEMTQFMAFLQSPAGLHFTEVSMQALEDALVQAADFLGQSLPKVVDAVNG
jgi:hypothetical protein